MTGSGPGAPATASGSSPKAPAKMRWVLPIVWGLGCVLGFSHHGDEYGLLAVGSILGVRIGWVWPVDHPDHLFLPALAVGCGLMFAWGMALEALRVRPRHWWIAWAAATGLIAALLLSQYASFAAAVAKNGSILAYLICASQLGAYTATIGAFAAIGIGRLAAAVRSRFF